MQNVTKESKLSTLQMYEISRQTGIGERVLIYIYTIYNRSRVNSFIMINKLSLISNKTQMPKFQISKIRKHLSKKKNKLLINLLKAIQNYMWKKKWKKTTKHHHLPSSFKLIERKKSENVQYCTEEINTHLETDF